MSQTDEYLRGMQRKVGWFVLIGLGALIVILLIAGYRSNFFAKKFYVFIEPPTASSFHEGLPVKFQGFAIGYVDNVELLGHGQVQITLQLLDRYRSMLHQGAIAQLTKEGMIGEQFVRLSAGNIKAPMIEPLTVLDYENEASLEQLLEDLKPTVELADKLLRETGSFVEWVNDPYSDVRLIMSNLGEFSDGLNSNDMASMGDELKLMMTHIRKILEEADAEHMMSNLSYALNSTGKTLDEVKPFASDLGKNGGKSLEKLDGLLVKMQTLTDNLNVISSDVTELTPALPGLTRELRDSLSESRVLMKTIQKSWLFGGGDADSTSPEGSYLVTPPAVDLRP
ncbi:MAG: MlaD family protein [Ghiorsea sp.]